MERENKTNILIEYTTITEIDSNGIYRVHCSSYRQLPPPEISRRSKRQTLSLPDADSGHDGFAVYELLHELAQLATS